MGVNLVPMRTGNVNSGTIFLSGSIPDPDRWEGAFDPLEITDAVVTFARACLTSNYRIVTAAHPTLAPLLLYVAAEFPPSDEPSIVVYQSLLFGNVLPTETRRFEAEGVGQLVWTDAHDGDRPEPGCWDASLKLMRGRMLRETDPQGAVFVGGMEGIRSEFDMFSTLHHDRPMLAVRRPGGEAATLISSEMQSALLDLDQELTYPSLWREYFSFLTSSTPSNRS